jgi:hypothetical protein
MSTATDRLRLRRRILRWTSPLLVAMALVGLKLLAMSGAASVAAAAFGVGDLDLASRAALTLGWGNVVEPHKAPFAEGTVRAARAETPAELAEAEALLREALRLVRGPDECAVRYNLAIVVEAQGDAAEDDAVAEARYLEAASIASDAPEVCQELPPLRPEGAPGDGPGEGGDDAEAGREGGDEGAAGEGRDEGDGDTSTGDGGGEGDRTAADDLESAAERSSGKASEARERLSQPPDESRPEEGEQEGEPGEERQPSPLSDPERREELQRRIDEAQQRQQEADGESAGELQDAAPTVPAPW